MKFTPFLSKIFALFQAATLGAQVVTGSTVADDDAVRSQCRAIFETAFPPHRWTTQEDLEAFAQLVSKSSDNYFACPVGTPEREITNFAPETDIMLWMEKHGFIPSDGFRYFSNIASPIQVTGKTCFFQHEFVGLVAGSCHVENTGNVVMELDDEGKMVRWADHWDFNAFNGKVGTCMAQLEAAVSA